MLNPELNVSPQSNELNVPTVLDKNDSTLFLGALITLGALGWLYHPTIVWMVGVWQTDEYYSHGFLLPLITLYLIWDKRQQIQQAWTTTQQKSRLSRPIGLLLAGLSLLFLATVMDVNFAKGLSLPLVLLGIVYFVAGRQVARVLHFPLLYLLMAVPLSGLMLQRFCVPMQNNAASWSSMGLGLLGIPITRDGVNLFTPHYKFVVAVPCSGLNTAITLLTLSVLVVHFLPGLTNWQRILLCIASIPIALIANTLRVSTIVLMGHFFGLEVAEGFFHNFSGLFIFALSFAMLVGLSHLLKSYATLTSDTLSSDVRLELSPVEMPQEAH